jgi:hypothetical protein
MLDGLLLKRLRATSSKRRSLSDLVGARRSCDCDAGFSTKRPTLSRIVDPFSTSACYLDALHRIFQRRSGPRTACRRVSNLLSTFIAAERGFASRKYGTAAEYVLHLLALFSRGRRHVLGGIATLGVPFFLPVRQRSTLHLFTAHARNPSILPFPYLTSHLFPVFPDTPNYLVSYARHASHLDLRRR